MMDASMGYVRRLSSKGNILTGFDLANADIVKDETGIHIRIKKKDAPLQKTSPQEAVNIQPLSKDQEAAANKEVETEEDHGKLLYRVSDTPSILMTILFAFQQTLMGLPFCVISAIMVAQAVCGDDDNDLKTRMLSTTVFLSAITTFLQATFGVRLPVYQGPTVAYILPLLVLSDLPEWKCPAVGYKVIVNATSGLNFTTNELDVVGYRENIIMPRLRAMQGCLIIAGAVHMLIGLTGFVGVLLKVVGPLTVVPTLLLIGIQFDGVMNTFCDPNWGISAGTCLISLILAVYLNGWNMPIPVITKSRGFHIIRYPLQQVLAVLFAICIGWGICGILTQAGALTTDIRSKEYKTRTDAGADTIERTPWFIIPYPGQFGSIGFNSGVFIAFVVATLLSVVESIADYYACARLCHVPPPPLSAMNRGIMVEGFMSMIAGFFGAGHATTTYSNNIGLIGITKVASRRVTQVLAIQLIVCAIIGKFGAVFVTIPYPVLGGSAILSFGLFLGIVMSYMQYTDMNSPRNLAVVGVSILVGIMVPNWVKVNFAVIKTGSDGFDEFLIMLLTNPSFTGGFIGFVLDNTVKGTMKERGIAAWALDESESPDSESHYEEGIEIYEISFLTKHLKKIPWMKYLPVFPTFTSHSCRNKSNKDNKDLKNDNNTNL
ncbi:solute carrier family 23 member 1-like isoform X1 [Mytilus edulis]|uniref:solute carrier family 23 member 1-like isoform X1 n=1 Tax=Mytilus edulis TaxID=6550 RepID=UPI0039EFD391